MPEYNILVVEDSAVMRQLISVALSRLNGALIDEAADGVEGLKKLSHKNYALIIVDINMPMLDGLKLIGHIRAHSNHAEVPVMVVTTEGMEEDRERALQLGANVYLTKPVNAARILQSAKELLGEQD